MKAVPSNQFHRSFKKAPKEVQEAFERKLKFLLEDRNHPSLRVKKYDESHGVWQARVNDDWRFYFTIGEDVYNLINITSHPK